MKRYVHGDLYIWKVLEDSKGTIEIHCYTLHWSPMSSDFSTLRSWCMLQKINQNHMQKLGVLLLKMVNGISQTIHTKSKWTERQWTEAVMTKAHQKLLILFCDYWRLIPSYKWGLDRWHELYLSCHTLFPWKIWRNLSNRPNMPIWNSRIDAWWDHVSSKT